MGRGILVGGTDVTRFIGAGVWVGLGVAVTLTVQAIKIRSKAAVVRTVVQRRKEAMAGTPCSEQDWDYRHSRPTTRIKARGHEVPLFQSHL